MGERSRPPARHECVKTWLLAALVAQTAIAGSSVVEDDLERRAAVALSHIHFPTGKAEADGQLEFLVRKLEGSLGFARTRPQSSASAVLYLPARLRASNAAVLLLFPHEDPSRGQCQALAAAMTRLGFIVLAPDLRADHDRLDLLPWGFAPEGLMQNDIRAGLKYLLSRKDVDGRRIGMVGSGLAATVAAAPDMKDLIGQMRDLKGAELPDTCDLIPGLLNYAATENLIAAIAPKPLLAINPAENVFDYATDLYRSFDGTDKLKLVRVPSGSLATIAPTTVELHPESAAVKEGPGKRQLMQVDLAALLGPALPPGQIT
jgi:hypothetical protein